MLTHMILYVKDQVQSTDFYAYVLNLPPTLNMPGMTEFRLSESSVLGLMPEAGIRKLLGPNLPDPAKASGVPRAEIYLVVEDAALYYSRALQRGASGLSELAMRDWGHMVAYCLDADGHVLAFAQMSKV